MNLLGAQALFSKLKVNELLDPALLAKKSPIERHHLFPKNYLRQIGITEKNEINQIANFALMEWRENIEISDVSPVEYFPHYSTRLTRDELTQMRSWHALPEGWEKMRYQEFLVARRRLLARIIRDGFDYLGKRSG